jgi:DNA-binding FrmR family transcriptional regulator
MLINIMKQATSNQTTNVSTTSSPDPLLTQLKRIRGQLDGVISMYEDERTCIDIVRQIIAARSSLGRVARDLLTGEAKRCSKERRVGDLDAVLKEVFRY